MNPTTPQPLPLNIAVQQAIAHHQAGRLQDAERLYRTILQAQPDHPDANHNLGVLAGQLGQHAAGLPYLRAALAINPSRGQYALSYASALLASGQAGEALNVLQGAMQRGLNTPAAGALRQRAEVAALSSTAKREAPTPTAINQLIALFSAGHYAEVESRVRLLLEQYPDSGFIWKVLGASLQMQGKEALPALQRTTQLIPEDAEAHNNLSNALSDRGQVDNAVASYRRALEIKPEFAEAHNNLGNALRDLGQLDDAVASYRRALWIKPDLAEAHSNMGNTFNELGRLEEAEASCRRALEIKPDFAEAHSNLGNTLNDLGRLDEAEASYRRALDFMSDFAGAHCNLGATLQNLGRLDEAEASCRRALEIKPDFAEAHNNMGNTFKDRGRPDEAEASYRRALEFKPDFAGAHCNLGATLQKLGRLDEAEACYRRALEIKPDFAIAHVAQTMIALPIAPQTVAASVSAPGEFDRALRRLSDWLGSESILRTRFSDAIGSQQPFFLAYRDGNHVECLSRYGDMVAKGAGQTQFSRGARRRKLRLAVVSQHFRRHSVWDVIIRGLLVHLDRARFELVLYHIGNSEDGETLFARSLADVWRDFRTIAGMSGWLDAIATDLPDVILYPEIGMDPMTLCLAARRLAPLQVASWGHPITTGLPTIDLYFSGEMIEPPEADAHYRERLVRLPGAGCCTTPIELVSEELPELEMALALRPGVRFLLAQRSIKFDPADDALYARIAATAGTGTFIILRDLSLPWATERLLARLSQAFREHGLEPEQHLLVISWLSREKFLGLLDLCDIYLDCPSFSGYTTAWQAVHRGLPVVTFEGKYMRQRLAAGLLRKIGVPDTIAASAKDYVAIAARLAQECRDPDRREARRRALRTAAPKSDHDIRVVRAFERSLIDALAERGRHFAFEAGRDAAASSAAPA